MSAFTKWIEDLEARYLADLRAAEVARAIRALSSVYVERRGAIPAGGALSGAGKRAAFALFYAPLHYLTVEGIVRQLDRKGVREALLVDLGCGTGAAGAAWAAAEAGGPGAAVAVDRSGWALTEAVRTYRTFGVPVRTRLGDMASIPWPAGRATYLAAFAVNELPDASRTRLLARLVDRARGGSAVLVVEPVARRAAPWWSSWEEALAPFGGRSDEWRFAVDLPPIVARLDRAAGLDHRELTARSLWVPNAGAPRA